MPLSKTGSFRVTGLAGRLAFAASALALASFSPPPASGTGPVTARPRNELRVVTLAGPTTYYQGTHGAEGLEFRLASEFARRLGMGLYMYPVPNLAAMRAELAAGRADIAAAQLTADASWREVGEAAAVYDHIPQLVVYRRGAERPNVGSLQEAELAVRADSPQEQVLQRLKRTIAPALNWMETAPRSADPLQDVEHGDADFAVVDANEFSFSRHLYPDVVAGFALSEDRPVQWVVRPDAPELYQKVNAFFQLMRDSGELTQLTADTSGNSRPFAYEESRRFEADLIARLPQYRAYFEQASAETGVDWRLLAAIAYQESQWDPEAESPTGAQGLMMLTSTTADSLGVDDRTDAQESILAGAHYFQYVRAKIPTHIPEPDRTWFAIAAYDIGYGHLEDARVLTQMRGKNPDSWQDVRAQLPLLASEQWTERLKHGTARGREPVQYVDRIQRFLKLLEWQPGEPPTGEQATRIEPAAPVATTVRTAARAPASAAS
jgi:membrane-bound lytic murein transglycosylase F